MLIGDFTAMIGDPTDKGAVRRRLTREEVLANCEKYKEQASRFIRFDGENAAELRFNADWLAKMTFTEVIGLASHFTEQQMMERDMFARRREEGKPVYVHELMYPLMQGYDSVAMDVDGEMGGNDQMFNMLAGRDLMKAMRGKEKFVITLKLLADTSGKKMGKSENNAITFLDSADDMFGKVMSWTDGMIVGGFELATDVPVAEVTAISRSLIREEANPRDLKARLAKEVARAFYGDAEANAAEGRFNALFRDKRGPDAEQVTCAWTRYRRACSTFSWRPDLRRRRARHGGSSSRAG
jgi:tyrosyl-tRNA synthetase